MKKALLGLFISLCFNSICQFTKEDFAIIKQNLKDNEIKGITSSFDKHAQTLCINSKTCHNTNLSLSFYFGIRKNEYGFHATPIRIKVRYSGSSWLFINELSFVNTTLKDGEEMSPGESMKTKDEDHNAYGTGVVELIDNLAKQNIVDFIRKTISEPRWIEMRASGSKGYMTLVMTKSHVLTFEPLFKTFDLYNNVTE